MEINLALFDWDVKTFFFFVLCFLFFFLVMNYSEITVGSKSKSDVNRKVFCLVIQHRVYPFCVFTQAVLLLL